MAEFTKNNGQKRSSVFSGKIGVTPSVAAAPGDTNPSDATVGGCASFPRGGGNAYAHLCSLASSVPLKLCLFATWSGSLAKGR